MRAASRLRPDITEEVRMLRPAAPSRPNAVSAAFSIILLTVTAACGRNDVTHGIGPNPLDASTASLPTEPPAISGSITLVQPGDSVQRSSGSGDPNGSVSCPPSCGSAGSPIRAVLIEEVPGGHGDNKSLVRLPRTTLLFRRTTSGLERIGFPDLRVGQKVVAWFTGPVAESYPTQANGRALVVVP
jgi:hypothetical protein